MINVLVLSCTPSSSTGKRMIEDFCNGSVDKHGHIEYHHGLAPIYTKNMPLMTYPENDTRIARNTEVRFFDFSAIDLDPLQDTPELIEMLDVAEVLFIADLDHIYQPRIGYSFCPFFSQQSERVSDRVSQFAKAINDNVDDYQVRCWAVITTSQTNVTNTPQVVTDALRYHNESRNGFAESQIFKCYTPETRTKAVGTLKATWESDAYQISIRGGVSCN